MVRILIKGSKHFCDQVKNKVEWMENEGLCSYTDDLEGASIVVSEGDACPYSSLSSSVLVYIETVNDINTNEISVAQTVMGTKIESFPISNLPHVLQNTILVVSMLITKERRVGELVKQCGELLELKQETEKSLKKFRGVQESVSMDLSELEDFDTKLLYIPKNEISGDFLVAKKWLDGRTFLFLGDVTGHGIYAGAYASTLIAATKSYFDTCSVSGADLQQFALHIARSSFYYHGGCNQSSAECVVCEIDPKKNLARFLTFSGGNISPILIKQNGEVKTIYTLMDEDSEEAVRNNEEVMQKIKPRIGEPFFEDNLTFDAMPGIFEERFCVGDSILFYTDGFSEMFSHTDGGKKDQSFVYGVENMERAVKDAVALKGNGPEVVVNSVVSDISSFGVKQLGESKALKDLIYDDATMLCIRRKQ